jgi:hypothetical protein
MPDNSIYSTRALLGAMYDTDVSTPPSDYWLSLCFPQQINFDEEFVDFSKLTSQRKLAPLVVPTTQGKPMYSAAEERVQVKPAYVKPKDAVSASRVIKKVAGHGELNAQPAKSPQARYNLLVADILAEHRRGIMRRWEWLASEAVQHGRVTLVGEGYPETVVDFKRDPSHTISLTGAARWGQPGVSIIKDIESWKSRTRKAKFGGPTNRLTVGADAWDIMRNDSELREAMKTDYKPGAFNGLEMNLGVTEGLDVEWVGRVSGTTDIYVYSDYYQSEDGTMVEFMDPRDVVLTGPSINGIRCFGAIQDVGAGFQPLEIFPKMWPEQDPSATFIMSQSAPLMVPVNPNASLRARVTNDA